MANIIYIIIYSLISVSCLIYIWHKLTKRNINFKDPKFYITLIGIMIIAIFNDFLVNKFIKIILITIVCMLFFWYLFRDNVKKCIITPIYYQIIVMISETSFILFLVYIFRLNLEQLKNQYLGTFLVNIITSINTIIIVKLPFIQNLYDMIINQIEKINKKMLIILSLTIIALANVLAATTYFRIDFKILIIINVIYTLFCFLIVLYSFKVQSNYKNVSDKYDVAINSLTDYENMMSKYRIDNHENKNLLLTVRAMIINKEKDIPKYIDSIVKEKYEDNEKLLLKMNVIPSGGLRATIYSEILKIKDNKINYTLDIDKKLKAVDIIELDTDTIIDICKVIGVFIDNAIEEVKKLKKKNINISLYIEDEFINIKVTNNYKEKINVNKIFEEGYTTKGKGHGYGLSLVKKIIDNNKNFQNKTEIQKDIFSQILIIKYKKTH